MRLNVSGTFAGSTRAVPLGVRRSEASAGGRRCGATGGHVQEEAVAGSTVAGTTQSPGQHQEQQEAGT